MNEGMGEDRKTKIDQRVKENMCIPDIEKRKNMKEKTRKQ